MSRSTPVSTSAAAGSTSIEAADLGCSLTSSVHSATWGLSLDSHRRRLRYRDGSPGSADASRPVRDFGGLVMAPAISVAGTTFYGCQPGQIDFMDCGLYRGPNPATDTVIKEGEPFLGSTIRLVCCLGGPFAFPLANGAINDFGQIAVAVQLADGRGFIVRANPVSASLRARRSGSGIGPGSQAGEPPES